MNLIRCSVVLLLFIAAAPGCRQTADESKSVPDSSSRTEPATADALVLLNDALETSKETGQHVLVHLSSPGCAPCRLLERMFHDNEDLFATDFIVLGIDQAKMPNGETVMEMVGSTGSTPWISILDSNGKVIADSIGPNGNIGYPVRKAEVEHFTWMMKRSMREPDDSTIERISALFPQLPDATTTPSSDGDETALMERNGDAVAIAVMAVQAHYQRVGKWPAGWNELDRDLGGVFDEIRDARGVARDHSDPFARGTDFASEESQSILSRLPELSGFGPADVRNHVEIDFSFDPESIDKEVNWVDFQGIRPHEPAFNVYRVEITKLISSLARNGALPASK